MQFHLFDDFDLLQPPPATLFSFSNILTFSIIMQVYALLCRHFLYSVTADKTLKPRRTCDGKKMYCNACLAARQQPAQENTLENCLQLLEALQITETHEGHDPGKAKSAPVNDLDKLLEGLSLQEDIDSIIQALQHKLRLDVDTFVEKHGEDATIAIVKHALKTWESKQIV